MQKNNDTGASSDSEQAWKYALRLLKIRLRTRSELAARLNGKGFSSDAAAAALDRLSAEGLIDDRRFAAEWVSARVRSRPRSLRILRWELLQKGIETEVIEQVLSASEGADELSLARDAAGKKRRQLAGIDEREACIRLVGYLQRRGFSAATIKTVTGVTDYEK